MTPEFKDKLFPYALFLAALLYIFLYRGCGNDKKQEVTISIPAVVGSFNKKELKFIKYDTIFQDTIVYKDKKVVVENPVNTKLAEDYLKAKDSLAKMKLFLSAIEIRRYKETFDDKDVTITVEAETTGKLNWVKPTYIVKEKKITTTVEIKKPFLRVYGGGGLGTNVELNKFNAFGQIGLQNKSDDILTFSVDLNKTIMAGYLFKLKL
jgi:hypothetical protein